MKKLVALALVIILALSLVACGGNSNSGGNSGGNSTNPPTSQGGNDNTPSSNNGSSNANISGTYKYSHPKDNYYVETKSSDDDYIVINARIGNGYTSTYYEEFIAYVDLSTGREWLLEDDMSWSEGEGVDLNDWDVNEYGVDIFGYMERTFMSYYRAFGKEDGDLVKDYGVGNEKVAGVNCWVIDTQGLNAIDMKFWIDPSNGCCLKYENKGNGRTEEVVKYDLNYKTWGANMKP